MSNGTHHHPVQRGLDCEFDYLLDKIVAAKPASEPFDHLMIEDFFHWEHFEQISRAAEVCRDLHSCTDALINDLESVGFEVGEFPGCCETKEDYLDCYESGAWRLPNDLTEGRGLMLWLSTPRTSILARALSFMNSARFKSGLEHKFGIQGRTTMSIRVQKYLDGYEISPHPDVRAKALTFMLNVNTTQEAEVASIHTHLLRFGAAKEHITSFWQAHPELDRCWVPWDWCETVFCASRNNNLLAFAPSNYSLHAVKLDYDHLKFQRTQFYGNLWFADYPDLERPGHLDLVRAANDYRAGKRTVARDLIQDSDRTP